MKQLVLQKVIVKSKVRQEKKKWYENVEYDSVNMQIA